MSCSGNDSEEGGSDAQNALIVSIPYQACINNKH